MNYLNLYLNLFVVIHFKFSIIINIYNNFNNIDFNIIVMNMVEFLKEV